MAQALISDTPADMDHLLDEIGINFLEDFRWSITDLYDGEFQGPNPSPNSE